MGLDYKADTKKQNDKQLWSPKADIAEMHRTSVVTTPQTMSSVTKQTEPKSLQNASTCSHISCEHVCRSVRSADRLAPPASGDLHASSEPSTPNCPRRNVRPSSAPIHNLSGRILRNIGDEYLCRSCGKTLQVLGDEMAYQYMIKKALSYNDLLAREEGD